MPFLSPARLLLSSIAAALLLAACGGGDNDDTSTVRFINATSGVGALDLVIDDETMVSAAPDATSDYFQIGDGIRTHEIRLTGTDSPVLAADLGTVGGERYSIVAWGRDGAEQLSLLGEEEDEPSSGQTKVRLFNAAQDVGPLDLYLTDAHASLDDVASKADNVRTGSASGYAQMSKGAYRLRITGAGDTDDLRLDVPSVMFDDRARTTIIVQQGRSGVLVHALLVVQEGGATSLRNTKARMRLVASVSSNGTVHAGIGNQPLSAAALASPAIGSYLLVPSGPQLMSVTVNGGTVSAVTANLLAGADYTLLAYGNAAAPALKMSTDDNRLPSNGKAKMRLVHGAQGYDALTLSLDAVMVADSMLGETSSYYSVDPNGGNALIEVTSPYSNDPLYTTEKSNGLTGVTIAQQGVYTVFMLGGNAAPRGVLRKER